jgi:hypothetical protein
MFRNYQGTNFVAALMFALFLTSTAVAQPKKPGAQTAVKASAKGTLAADMDCLVKLNGSQKPISLKAYTPLDVNLNIGENSVEATSTDKKSTFKKKVTAKSGEKIIVEISFFDDGKFLDYVKQGNTAMVETAIKKDPSLATNADGNLTTSPLEIAIDNSQPDMVKFLMSKGASYTVPDNIFPLHKAILHASSSKPAKDKPAPDKVMVDFFLSKGCQITDKDDGGNTPLHCAVRAGKLDMVTFLVDKGADVNAKNDFEDTPLKIAQDKGMISIINFLKTKGALEK